MTTTTALLGHSPRSVNGTLMARKIIKKQATTEGHSPDDVLTWSFFVERVTRIELALSAWEADVLPLNYTRGGSALAPRAHSADPIPARISYRNATQGAAWNTAATSYQSTEFSSVQVAFWAPAVATFMSASSTDKLAF